MYIFGRRCQKNTNLAFAGRFFFLRGEVVSPDSRAKGVRSGAGTDCRSRPEPARARSSREARDFVRKFFNAGFELGWRLVSGALDNIESALRKAKGRRALECVLSRASKSLWCLWKRKTEFRVDSGETQIASVSCRGQAWPDYLAPANARSLRDALGALNSAADKWQQAPALCASFF